MRAARLRRKFRSEEAWCSSGLLWALLALLNSIHILGASSAVPTVQRSLEERADSCRTGSCLAEGMANSSLSSILLLNDIKLVLDDWNGIGLPVVLQRNLTMRGPSPEPGTWPTLDMNFVRDKVGS